MRTQNLFRGGLVVLALLALVGLLFVACHKKEGAEKTGVAIPAPAVAPTPVTAPAEQAQVPVVPAVPADAIAANPAETAQSANVVRQVNALATKPEDVEAERAISKPIKRSAALPEPAAPVGGEPPAEETLPVTVNFGPIEPLTVVVSELPVAEPRPRDAVGRPRMNKEKFVVRPIPGVDQDENLQDASDPNTPPSSLVAGDETRAQIDPGAPAVAFIDWSAATTDGVPFDVDMAVGLTHLMTDVNTQFKVYDKVGTLLTGPTAFDTFWSGLPNCGNAGYLGADPQISYDDENDRWVMLTLRAQLSADQTQFLNSWLCVACSQTGNPTGAWNKYEIADGAGLADYPHIGIGEDAIFIGTNHFTVGRSFDYPYVTAIQKSAAYAGTAITPVKKSVGALGVNFTPQPAERRGFAQGQYPPSGTPHMFVVQDGAGAAQIWRWTYPTFNGGATLTQWGQMQAFGGTPPDIAGTNITSVTIDGNDSRIMDAELRWPYLWYTRGGAATQGSIMWAGANVSGATPNVYQSGEYSDSNRTFHWSDCTVDSHQNFAVGFTAANNATTTFPSAYITGREDGITTANQLEAYRVSRAGEVRYVPPSYDNVAPCRWGDYAGVAIDPNGCDIWFHGQYSSNTGAGNPLTRTYVQKFKFPSCVAGATRQAFVDRLEYTCVATVNATIIDTGGAPTDVAYNTTTGGKFPTTVSGGPNSYVVAPVNMAQLGAADGDDVWVSFKGSDLADHTSLSAKANCAKNVCVVSVDPLAGGCDNDVYMDRDETLNVFVNIQNNEAYDLTTGFTADLRVDPAFPDANITIVKGTAEYAALAAGAIDGPVGVPFQVRCTGGTNIRTVNFEVYNIRAVDDSWTGGSGCGAGVGKFTKIANANDQLGTPYTGFPESFDGATFPPASWNQAVVDGAGGAWARATATVHPAGLPTHSGAGLAYFNSWTVLSGNSARLFRTVDANTSTSPNVAVSYWMFKDTQYPTAADYVQVQVSTNGGTSWVDAGGKVYRNTANRVWQQSILDISAEAGGKTAVRIGLLAMSDYGNDVHVDDVTFAPVNKIADTSTCAGAPIITLSSSTYGTGYWLADTQCNANGYADTGDAGTMLFYLSNSGNENAYGVTATLSCPSCPAGVTICKNTATYGDIPYASGYNYAQPDNGFQVALPTGLASGTALPWVITVNTTNTPAYSTTINVPTEPAGRSRSGTYTWVDNGDPYVYSIADYVGLAPNTAGATGRYGFTSAWAVTSNVTRVAAADDIDGNGFAAQLRGNNEQTMAHTFSTVGVNGTINTYWIFDIGRAATTARVSLEYTNDGTNWYNIISGGTGIAGLGLNQSNWTTYGYFSLYWQIYNQAVAPGYGPAAANAMLNNPNFGLRLRCTYGGGQATNFRADCFWIDFYKWENTATPCTGVCIGPDAPVVTEVRDVDPCTMNGIKVFFEQGLGAASTALYKDGASAVPSYASGDTYAPGDTASHNYTVRATNAYGSTNSTPATAGSDAAGTVVPTFSCAPGTCSHATSVLLTTQAGLTNYQWYRNAVAIGGANSDTYTATQSGTYTVAYKQGACTNLSTGTVVTIGGASNPPAVPNNGDVPGTPFRLAKNGSNVDITWDATCVNDTDYRVLWGNLTSLSLVSGVTNGTVTSATCNLGTTGSALNQSSPSPTAGQCFFAVIDAVSGSSFGRHGNNTAGNERVLSGDTTFCGASTKNTTATTCQ